MSMNEIAKFDFQGDIIALQYNEIDKRYMITFTNKDDDYASFLAGDLEQTGFAVSFEKYNIALEEYQKALNNFMKKRIEKAYYFMRTVQCEVCKQYFEKKDIRDIIYYGSLCNNCSKEAIQEFKNSTHGGNE